MILMEAGKHDTKKRKGRAQRKSNSRNSSDDNHDDIKID